MITLTLKQIADYTGGKLTGNGEVQITSVTTDSRKACEGSLFACIKGEKTDGHKYIPQAVKNGAAAVLCESEPERADVSFVLVNSTVEALGQIATAILETAKIPVVAVAGSVGKTSTKEMIASVLSQQYNVLKTEANFNNELGLPLTVFNLKPEHEAAVLELGIDDFGQMHHLASIARPDICVFTNIGDCHLEQLGDRRGVWRAKSEMIDHMKENGAIVLNGDDAILREQKNLNGKKPVFYGFDEENDFRACNIQRKGTDGSDFEVRTDNGSISVHLSVSGDHNIRNALAAAAVGAMLDVTMEQIRAGIENYRTIDGRFKINKTEKYTVIDDCYNANPMSMKAALLSLSQMKGRKVAVLGDMGELGTDAERFHYEVGNTAGKLEIQALYCAGTLSKAICDGAKDVVSKGEAPNPELEIRHFQTREELTENLTNLVLPGDVILVKASHFMEFGEIVELLKNGN